MDKRIIYRLLVFGVVLIILFSLACINQEGKLTPEEILNRSETVMKNINSYAFDTSMLMRFSGNATRMVGGGEMSMKLNTNSKIDVNKKRMYMTGTMSLMGMSMPVEEYIIENTQYMKSPMGGWTKREIKIMWNDINMANKISMIKKSNLTLEGSEGVSGEDCYIIKVTPTPKGVIDMIGRSMGDVSGMGEGKEEFLKAIKNVELKEWISKKDFTVRKAYINMSLENMGTSVTIEITMNLHDFNKPMNIELPDDARNATEISKRLYY